MPHVPRNKLFYPNASQVAFIPSVLLNWESSPTNVQIALDELADRLYEIEIGDLSTDASFVTYTPSEDSLSCWYGSADPGNVNDALDQVSLRLCDIESNPILYYIFDIQASPPSNPVIGQFYYNSIDQLAYFYNGSTWISMSSGAASSIAFSGITSGTNISATMIVGTGASFSYTGSGVINANQFKGNSTVAIADGGTGQTTATAAFNALSPTTTKGDLITRKVGGNDRKVVGVDGEVLTADSGTADGLAWRAPDHGALTGLFDDDHAQYILLDPLNAARNKISPSTDDITALTLVGANRVLLDIPILDVQDKNNNSVFQVFQGDEETYIIISGTGVPDYNNLRIKDYATIDIYDPVGSNYVRLQSPTLVSNWTLTFPSNDGSNLQFLHTDGSGVTSWVTPDHGSLLGLSDDDHSQYIYNVPGSSSRNIIAPTIADVVPLLVRQSSGTFSTAHNIFTVQTNGGVDIANIYRSASSAYVLRLNTNAGSSGTVGYVRMDSFSGRTTGYIDTSAASAADGGFINTSGNSSAGGSITTSDGGGSIDTTGNGFIQFGTSSNRITLQGTSSSGGKTQTLPNITGTVIIAASTSTTNTQICMATSTAGGVAFNTVSGDITIGSTGVTAIGTNVVTLAMMAQIATASILGRNTGGTGNVEVLSAATTKTLLSLDLVENTALSTWAGSTNITTLGTIATGTWSGSTIAINKGGTGQTTANDAFNALAPSQTGNSGKVLTTNGTNTSWASIANVTSATVDFGSVSSGESFSTSVTVTGQTWVTASSKIICSIFAEATAEHDIDDYMLEGIQVYATNIVNGTGFDIIAIAPNGTFGRYVVHCIGV